MTRWMSGRIKRSLQLVMIGYPHAILEWVHADPRRMNRLPRTIREGLGGANGQFLLFKKSAYERIGGHAAVKWHMVEDVAMGRKIAELVPEGLVLVNCDGALVSRVRMYESFADVWEGFTKNVRAAFEDSLSHYLMAVVVMTTLFFLPFVWVWSATGTARWLVLAQLAAIYAIRGRIAARFGTSWVSCAFHPVAQLLGTAIALNSWRCTAGKGVTWKGRRYHVALNGKE